MGVGGPATAAPAAKAPSAAAPTVTAVSAAARTWTGVLTARRQTVDRVVRVRAGLLTAETTFDSSCSRIAVRLVQGGRVVAMGTGATGLALSGGVRAGTVRVRVRGTGCAADYRVSLTSQRAARTPKIVPVATTRVASRAAAAGVVRTLRTNTRRPNTAVALTLHSGYVTVVTTFGKGCPLPSVSVAQGRSVLAAGVGRTGLALAADVRRGGAVLRVTAPRCRGGYQVQLRQPGRATPTIQAVTNAALTTTRQYAHAGGATYVVSGTNVLRGTDQLVVYTRTAAQTVTPTNAWGAEATVVGGVVTAVNDRQPTGGRATPIPAGGYVLSGHNRARSWVLAYAKPGTTVVLDAFPTTPVRTPPPTPPAPAPTMTTPAPAPVPTTTTPAPVPTTTTPAPVPTTTSPAPDPTTTTPAPDPTTTTPAPAPTTTAPVPAPTATTPVPAPTTTTPAPVPTTTTPAPVPTTQAPAAWLSGASGNGAANGTFGTWRGTAVQVGGTWNDSLDAQTNQWSIQPGAEWGSWDKDLDLAVGAIYSANGETWAKAAAGAYDARWTTMLTNIKKYWGARTGTLHLRFAHEFNGSWTPWTVTGATAADFVTAWKRFRALQRQLLPQHKLVFSPNDGTSTSQNLDWRKAFPGAAYVDEMGVDTYNQYPFVTTAAGFAAKIAGVDAFGAPVGIEKHRQFAASVGLPLAISEWSSNSSMGDSASFVHEFFAWVKTHAGTGAGQVPYEVMFNVNNYNNGVFAFYPATAQPGAAGAYVADF